MYDYMKGVANSVWEFVSHKRSCTPPGVSHRTFGFRTHSNSMELFRSIELDGVLPSNSIELTKKFESNKIERSIFELS